MRELIRFATQRAQEPAGPSETIPLIAGRLALSCWRKIFFCEFDGPRSQRSVVATALADH